MTKDEKRKKVAERFAEVWRSYEHPDYGRPVYIGLRVPTDWGHLDLPMEYRPHPLVGKRFVGTPDQYDTREEHGLEEIDAWVQLRRARSSLRLPYLFNLELVPEDLGQLADAYESSIYSLPEPDWDPLPEDDAIT